MKTLKQIRCMDYGTVAQMDEADAWMDRFMLFVVRFGYLCGNAAKIAFSDDVGYQAKRRWNYREDEKGTS